MGERKGVNKYYPPDFDPAKHGSLNGYHKSHPLRERARKLSQGILIIRFEMPYNIWCDGCKNHIGMGVRYNAEKKKVGNYYTTPIYRFRMKCHLCVNYIEMQTDPATCDYVIVSGARRKEERWDMADNEQILTTEHSEKEKLETDAMYKLDHGGRDKEKLRAAIPSLSELQEHQSSWKDDFLLNSTLRRKFRVEKKVMAEEEEKDNAVRKRTGLSIPLLPEKEEDKRLAALLTFQSPDSYEDRKQSKRKEIASRSWFSSPTGPQSGAAGSLLQKLVLTGKGTPQRAPGLIRKKSDADRPAVVATLARRKSDPGAVSSAGATQGKAECGTWERDEPNPEARGTDFPVTQPNREDQEAAASKAATEANVHATDIVKRDGGPETSGASGTEEDCETRPNTLRSLVADYSDSDSDPGP
ncbi:hypothetical protein MATL_G00003670 [Megalops atlanticus]|uniref:Probable splicing factor YJU2B n=1 Tax=Megalops atlanticus TaxID=7932 RepID=A0A9D3QK55_MEGAT|nr:hypothetical protein MATL_G00003670 [Megalops atlanticus]